MNIQARNELMAVLNELSTLVPYIRLGQLLGILAGRVNAPWADRIVDIEDEEFLPVAKEFLAAMKRLPPESIAAQIRGHLESDQYAQQAAG